MEQIENALARRIRPRRDRADYEHAVYNEFPVSYTPVRAGHYNIYLFGPIEDVSQFIGPIEVLQAAGENDLVEIHLSTPGGDMNATDTFLQAMHECEGRVVVRASGGVHSCGSIILMHANEFTLSENFNTLIHNGSTGTGGDLNKFTAAAKHSVEYMTKVLRQTYEGFLTPEELDAMIEGKDFWLNGEEFMRRWNLRQEHFKLKLADAQQALGMLVEEAEEVVEVTPRPPRRRRKQPAE